MQRLRLRHIEPLHQGAAVLRLRRKAPAAIGKPPPPPGKEGREMVEVEVETDYAEVEQQADDNKRGKSAADDNKQRVCPECGAAFVPRYGGQVCCSDECKAARRKMQEADRYRFRDQTSEIAFREERRAKARRRAAFFATRDAAFERAGLPIPKIEIRNGIVIERRGTVPLGCHAADFIRHNA